MADRTGAIRKIARATIEAKRASASAPDEGMLALVNAYAVEPLTADDVYVRSALICNDRVDYYNTQFTLNALQQIAALVPGVSLMRNHDEFSLEALPVGRFIKAEVAQDTDGAYCVRAWFYYVRGTDCGDEMERMIAAGIWREVSVSWWMRSFVSSIDGKPMSETDYPPGAKQGEVVAVGIMDDVVEVNEVSLVSRGGQKGTSIGGARSSEMGDMVEAARSRVARRGSVTVSGDPLREWWSGGSAAVNRGGVTPQGDGR